MTNGDRDNIIEKIQALLAKTPERGATEEEAASALEMAQKLLAKHNLSMAEVAEVTDDDSSGVTEDWIMAKTNGSMGWIFTLANGIAQNNFTKVLKGRAYNFKVPVYFVGREANVAVCKELFAWVAPQIHSKATKLKNETGQRWTYYSSCADGMAMTVAARLTKVRQEQEAQEVKLRALAIRYNEDIDDYLQEMGVGKACALGGEHNYAGYQAGVEAGASVSIMPSGKQIE